MSMLSPLERKKNNFAKSLLPSYAAEIKKYDEVYTSFVDNGYTKELCELYADNFINDIKKPAVDDIVQIASLYDKIHDNKSAAFYLDMISDKKLSGDEKFAYCIEVIKNESKLGHWRDAEDFRTEHINFLQNYAQKKSIQQQADMYIALALADCAAKQYPQALKLLNFGYKPQGRNDEKLLEIFITVVYIYACWGDEEGLEGAVINAVSCLKLFKDFEFGWSKKYYEKRIIDASNGIL